MLGVSLKPNAPPVTEALRERIRDGLKQALPDVTVSFEAADIISQVMSFGSPTPIEVAVQGPALAASRAFAEKVRAELVKVDALRDLQYAQPLDYPSMQTRSTAIGPGSLACRRPMSAGRSSQRPRRAGTPT